MILVSEIAELISGEIDGQYDLPIKDICELKDGKVNCISFFANSNNIDLYIKSKASAVIVNNALELPKINKTIIRVENSLLAFSQVSLLFRPKPKQIVSIHPSSSIASTAKIGSNVSIGVNVVIEDYAEIGDNVHIGANTTIGKKSVVGSDSCIMSNVSIYHCIKIGSNVHIDSGTVIGADGFGIVTHKGTHHRIPHTGVVEIGDYVAIGSNCSIDRGTINATIIGKFSKLDNLIQVSHNVVIGEGCIIAGQSGIAGSTVLGNYVTIGGQSGIVGHIKIGDKCVIGADTLVTKTLKPDSFVSGNPARVHLNRKKQDAIINRLPELYKRIINLEKEISKIN